MHNTLLHCIKLYHTTHHYTSLHNTTQHCTTLNSTAHHYTALHNTAQHCTTLHSTAQHYTALQNTTQHCKTLHKTAQNNYTTLHSGRQHCTALNTRVLICRWGRPGVGTRLKAPPSGRAVHCTALHDSVGNCSVKQQTAGRYSPVQVVQNCIVKCTTMMCTAVNGLLAVQSKSVLLLQKET